MASPEPKRVHIPKNGVDYRGKVVLAPMVRSGELPSRLLALKYGADLVWGPETIDKAIIGTTRRFNEKTQTLEFSRMPTSKIMNPVLEQKESIIYRIHPALEKGRLIYQIGTADPELAVEAAKIVAADVTGIDVNAGCPKPFSTSGGMGAALLKTPDLLCSILTALVEHVGKPYEIGISVKIRILETPEETETLVRRLVQTGITGLTVHCRTRDMRPRERAIRTQLSMVADICHEAGVACVMNGDVISRTQAFELMKEYGVDGAMIATEAEKNPGCFRPEATGGPHEWRARWRTHVEDYMRFALGVENRWGNTKFLLAQMIPGKDETFDKMTKSKCYRDVVRALDLESVEGMVEMATSVDKKVGLPQVETRAEKKAKVREAKKAAAVVEVVKEANREAVTGEEDVDEEAEGLRRARKKEDDAVRVAKRKAEEEESVAKRVKLPEVVAQEVATATA